MKTIIATRYLNRDKFAELLKAGHAWEVDPGVAQTYNLLRDAYTEWIAVDDGDTRTDTVIMRPTD